MKKVLFVADFFAEHIPGGGELFGEEVIKFLLDQNFEVTKIQSHRISLDDIKDKENILISNFINLPISVKNELSRGSYNYCIIEHDWKLCHTRNILSYPKMIIPENYLLEHEFYKNAKAIFCQSKAHAELFQKNLWTENVVNLGCNLWSTEHLNTLETILTKVEKKQILKNRKYGIMESRNPIKGTVEAIKLCRDKNISFELIPTMQQEKFWEELAQTDTIVFLPQSYETYSRFIMEAKILGCKTITNKAIGAMSEDYYSLNGRELLDKIKREEIVVLFKILNVLLGKGKEIQTFFLPNIKPKVSLITTVYKGSKFMTGFLDAFVKQTYSGPTELVVIDANSPENEHEIIQPYLVKYPNIIYKKLDEKVTTAKAFNIATEIATGEFISTVMIDDRMAPNYMDILTKHIFLDKEIDLVYGDTLVSTVENEKFEDTKSTTLCEYSLIPFSKENMIKNIQGALPMYRKSAHQKIGGYNEEILHGTDWDYVIRLVKSGSVFKKVNKRVGLYYSNPNGLSTSDDPKIVKERRQSERKIFEEHKELYPENYKKFKTYFDQWKD